MLQTISYAVFINVKPLCPSLMSSLLPSTKGCLQSFRRGFHRCSHRPRSSFRYWAQLCSERHCPSLARNWTTTRITSVNWTAMLLPCCSHRSAVCIFCSLFLDIYKIVRGCFYLLDSFWLIFCQLTDQLLSHYTHFRQHGVNFMEIVQQREECYKVL